LRFNAREGIWFVAEGRTIRGPGGNPRTADGARRGGTALGIGCRRLAPCECGTARVVCFGGNPRAEIQEEALKAHGCSCLRANQLHDCSLLSARRARAAPPCGMQTSRAAIDRRASNHPAEKEMKIATVAQVSAMVIVSSRDTRTPGLRSFPPAHKRMHAGSHTLSLCRIKRWVNDRRGESCTWLHSV
jgi:hypothetical protein